MFLPRPCRSFSPPAPSSTARKLTDEDTYFPPFRDEDGVTATEAVVAIAEMMRAADLNTFDLAMWMSRPHDG